jgi:hypothetical protein
MKKVFRFLVVVLMFNLLTYATYSASNQCYYSGEHYLGFGSTYTLDSTVIIKQRDREFVSRIAYTFKIKEDTLYHTYQVIPSDDSIIFFRGGVIMPKDRVWLFTDTSDHDTNLVVNTRSVYFNDKYKIDSTVEMRKSDSALAELNEKEIYYNTDSAQIKYHYYPNIGPYIDSTVFNSTGLIKYSIEDDSIRAIDTCISLDTICVCHGDSRDCGWQYQVINDQVQYEHGFFGGTEEEIRHFWSYKQSSIHRVNSKRRRSAQFDGSIGFTLDGRRVEMPNGRGNPQWLIRP